MMRIQPDNFSFDRLTETVKRSGAGGVYQQASFQIICRSRVHENLTELGDKLLIAGEYAYSAREMDGVAEVSRVLFALPLPHQYKRAACYFQGLCALREGDHRIGEAILQPLTIEPHKYRAAAIQSLGGSFHQRGDSESALKLYAEAMRCAMPQDNVVSVLNAQRNIAAFKSDDGDHRGALEMLEKQLPVAIALGSTRPAIYYDHINSLAVELMELGQLERATHLSKLAVGSPYAGAYHEWRETWADIEHKNRRASSSVVAVGQPAGETVGVEEHTAKTNNLVRMPHPQHPATAAVFERNPEGGARVLNFQQWKKMVKASSRLVPEQTTPDQLRRMSTGEKLVRLMDLISQDETDDETIDRILEAVEQIVLNRQSGKLN